MSMEIGTIEGVLDGHDHADPISGTQFTAAYGQTCQEALNVTDRPLGHSCVLLETMVHWEALSENRQEGASKDIYQISGTKETETGQIHSDSERSWEMSILLRLKGHSSKLLLKLSS